MGDQCDSCWTPAFPPKIVCPNCDKPMHQETKITGVKEKEPFSPPIDEEVLRQSMRITNFASIPDTTRQVIPYSEIISKEIHSGVIYQAV